MPRAMKVCSEPGCPEIIPAGRCPAHRREADRRRGSARHRGYDTAHDRTRVRLLAALTPGTPCPRCGQPMWPDQRLDAGHSVDLRDNPHARADRLEHAACNRGWRRT